MGHTPVKCLITNKSATIILGDESRELVVGLASVCLVVLVVLGMYLRRKLVTQYGIDLNLSCCDKGTVKSSNESSTLGEHYFVLGNYKHQLVVQSTHCLPFTVRMFIGLV